MSLEVAGVLATSDHKVLLAVNANHAEPTTQSGASIQLSRRMSAHSKAAPTSTIDAKVAVIAKPRCLGEQSSRQRGLGRNSLTDLTVLVP